MFVPQKIADVERDLILCTLYHFEGNRTHAARALGICIRTLRNKLDDYRAQGEIIPKNPRCPTPYANSVRFSVPPPADCQMA